MLRRGWTQSNLMLPALMALAQLTVSRSSSLVVFSGLYPIRSSISTDDGLTWTRVELGKRLAVMDVRIWTDDADKPVGQANVT